jgi:hypothetical protein
MKAQEGTVLSVDQSSQIVTVDIYRFTSVGTVLFVAKYNAIAFVKLLTAAIRAMNTKVCFAK